MSTPNFKEGMGGTNVSANENIQEQSVEEDINIQMGELNFNSDHKPIEHKEIEEESPQKENIEVKMVISL